MLLQFKFAFFINFTFKVGTIKAVPRLTPWTFARWISGWLSIASIAWHNDWHVWKTSEVAFGLSLAALWKENKKKVYLLWVTLGTTVWVCSDANYTPECHLPQLCNTDRSFMCIETRRFAYKVGRRNRFNFQRETETASAVQHRQNRTAQRYIPSIH